LVEIIFGQNLTCKSSITPAPVSLRLQLCEKSCRFATENYKVYCLCHQQSSDKPALDISRFDLPNFVCIVNGVSLGLACFSWTVGIHTSCRSASLSRQCSPPLPNWVGVKMSRCERTTFNFYVSHWKLSTFIRCVWSSIINVISRSLPQTGSKPVGKNLLFKQASVFIKTEINLDISRHLSKRRIHSLHQLQCFICTFF